MGDLTGVRVLDPAEGISLVSIQPNLFFNGHCAEAANFLGAKVQMVMRNKESLDVQPESMVRKGAEDKILPMNLHIGDTQLMMSDGDRTGIGDFKGLGLTYNVADAERVFARLGDGGQVQMPLSKTFFHPPVAWSTTASGCCGW